MSVARSDNAARVTPHSFLSMLGRISDLADVAEVARLAKDWETRAAATRMVDDHATLEDMARGHWGDWRQAAKRLGGYGCVSCGTTVLPDDDATAPCTCPACSVENHDWEHVNGEIVHRDYSSGMSYDYCTRRGKKKNIIDHNTL